MISIKANGQDADLASASVTYEKPSGLLEFDFAEPSITSSLEFADSPKNRAIFGWIHRPQSLAPFSAPIQAQLEWAKMAVASGELVLTGAEQEKGVEGFFRADAGSWASNRDTKISDLIGHLTVTIGVGSPPYSDAPFEIAHNSDVVFPKAIGRHNPIYREPRPIVRIDRSAPSGNDTQTRNFTKAYDRNRRLEEDRKRRDATQEFASTESGIEEIVFYNQAQPTQFGRTRKKNYLPAFKIKHLLSELATAIGYQLVVKDADYTLNYGVLWAWRSSVRFPNQNVQTYAYFLPSLTLSEFINGVRTMGTAIYIDSASKIITARPFDSISGATAKHVGYAQPWPKIERAFEDSESVFAFSQSTEKEPNITVVRILPAPSTGDVAFVESQNQLYEAQNITVGNDDFLDWRPTEVANIKARLSTGGKDVQSIFAPLANLRQFYFTCTGVQIRNYAGNVMLNNLLFNTLDKSKYQFRIIEPEALSTGWFIDLNPTATPSDPIVLNIPYTQDYDDAVVEYRNIPTAFGECLMPSIPEEVGAYISLYHGPVTSPGGELYGYASASGYDDGYSDDRITDQDLYMSNILDTRMSTAKRVFEAGKKATFRIMPSAIELASFNAIEPIEIDGAKLIVDRLTAELGDKPIEGSLSGWIVQ